MIGGRQLGHRLREATDLHSQRCLLINIATALLLVLAIALYVVSINAQWAYVMHVKHNDLVSWIEAASLDGGMGVFTLLALGLSRAGQAARIERLFIVICALGSAAMNFEAAQARDIKSALSELQRLLLELTDLPTWIDGIKELLSRAQSGTLPWPYFADEHKVWA